MTETPTTDKPARRSSGGLGGKVLAELQQIAADLGIDGAGMRKGALIDAIKTARGDAPAAPKDEEPQADAPKDETSKSESQKDQGQKDEAPKGDRAPRGRGRGNQSQPDDAQQDGPGDKPQRGQGKQDKGSNDKGQNDKGSNDKGQNDKGSNDKGQNDKGNQSRNKGESDTNRQQNNRNGGGNDNRQQGNQNANQGPDDDDNGGRRRNRRGRNRNTRGMESEPTYSEDDVLVPAAGILDILDNYAFVRTTGYLPSENDVYVSLSMVRKWNLRRGDAVTGQVRQPREGERKEKFNPMVKVETVNGMSLEDSAKRVEFSRLTPLHPSERLRLEGGSGDLTARLVDLVAPIGKGQRGLVVSPPRAGKTTVLQQIAHAITENNPECHLMVVLVDERPEEVTDFQRSVKGEVIASTFDRPAADHTTVAELAIERAKRLVELGHDVVVLLDGITRLGRAYHQSAAGSGRAAAGGVDASALHPAKSFFGAARNAEDGGSLTILATASVETGSGVDEAILEEFVGAGNWELRLDRSLADKRIHPAIDVAASSTRREGDLVGADAEAATSALRRTIVEQGTEQALATVVDGLQASSTNAEFLAKVGRTGASHG